MVRKLAIALAAATALVVEAEASGGFSCAAEDAAARITIEAGVTHGMGSPVFSFRAEARITGGDVAEDLRRASFEREHLAQYWLGDDELKLVLYRERAGDKAHGFVHIVIRTRMNEEGGFAGRYELTTYDMTGVTGGEAKQARVEGEISCAVE